MTHATQPSRIATYALGNRPERQPPARPAGRPKTRTPGHYAALREEYGVINLWFEEVFGRPATSDAELLKAHVSAELERQGLESSLLASPEVQGHLKTLRNELCKAKKLSAIPINWLFAGRGSPVSSISAP